MKMNVNKLVNGLVFGILVLVLSLALVPVVASAQNGGDVEAAYAASAKKYVGTYTWKSQKKVARGYADYYVYVKKAKGSKITFGMYRSMFGTASDGAAAWESASKVITAKVKKGVAKFKWKDDFGNKGTGKLKFGKNKVRLSLKVTHYTFRGIYLEVEGKTGTKVLKRTSKKAKAKVEWGCLYPA